MNTKNRFILLWTMNHSLFIFMLLATTSIFTTQFSLFPFEIPSIVFKQIGFYFLAQIALYTALSTVQALTVSALKGLLNLNDDQSFYLTLLYWTTCLLWILCCNQHYFPLSKFSILLSSILPDSLSYILNYLLGFGLLLSTLLSFAYYLNRLKQFKRPIFLGLASISTFFFFYSSLPSSASLASTTQPNILFLGIDSLQIPMLNTINTPTLMKQLKSSVYFSHATTPLARTYPSWMGLLTGLEPKDHGARFNLPPENTVKTKASLAYELKQAGYATLYATDEKRFSNIDTSLGFDTIVGPQMGVNDFVLGMLNDFPLSNLLINTPIGKWLFPFSYTNRSTHITYYPHTFINEIMSQLPRSKQPLFLAIHLTTTHWPYLTANPPASLQKPQPDIQALNNLVPYSMQMADKQIAQIIKQLKMRHFFDNAIVVFLSDHGETLNTPHSRLTEINHYQGKTSPRFLTYVKQKKDASMNQSFGHGSDVLSPEQYHALLAIQRYPASFPSKIVDQPVSLIDLKPTILELLYKPKRPANGISLVKILTASTYTPPKNSRYFYFENGFTPEIDFNINPKKQQKALLRIGASYYDITPSQGRVTLKKSQLPIITKYKQVAVQQNNWLLALYPLNKQLLPIIINLTTKQWSDNLNSTFSQQSPSARLLSKLIKHFDLDKKRVI